MYKGGAARRGQGPSTSIKSERRSSKCNHAQQYGFDYLMSARGLAERVSASPGATVRLCIPCTQDASELLGSIRAGGDGLVYHISSPEQAPGSLELRRLSVTA